MILFRRTCLVFGILAILSLAFAGAESNEEDSLSVEAKLVGEEEGTLSKFGSKRVRRVRKGRKRKLLKPKQDLSAKDSEEQQIEDEEEESSSYSTAGKLASLPLVDDSILKAIEEILEINVPENADLEEKEKNIVKEISSSARFPRQQGDYYAPQYEYPPNNRPYNINYTVLDDKTGITHVREEAGDGQGYVVGMYEVVEPGCNIRRVCYKATDEGGFEVLEMIKETCKDPSYGGGNTASSYHYMYPGGKREGSNKCSKYYPGKDFAGNQYPSQGGSVYSAASPVGLYKRPTPESPGSKYPPPSYNPSSHAPSSYPSTTAAPRRPAYSPSSPRPSYGYPSSTPSSHNVPDYLSPGKRGPSKYSPSVSIRPTVDESPKSPSYPFTTPTYEPPHQPSTTIAQREPKFPSNHPFQTSHKLPSLRPFIHSPRPASPDYSPYPSTTPSYDDDNDAPHPTTPRYEGSYPSPTPIYGSPSPKPSSKPSYKPPSYSTEYVSPTTPKYGAKYPSTTPKYSSSYPSTTAKYVPSYSPSTTASYAPSYPASTTASYAPSYPSTTVSYAPSYPSTPVSYAPSYPSPTPEYAPSYPSPAPTEYGSKYPSTTAKYAPSYPSPTPDYAPSYPSPAPTEYGPKYPSTTAKYEPKYPSKSPDYAPKYSSPSAKLVSKYYSTTPKTVPSYPSTTVKSLPKYQSSTSSGYGPTGSKYTPKYGPSSPSYSSSSTPRPLYPSTPAINYRPTPKYTPSTPNYSPTTKPTYGSPAPSYEGSDNGDDEEISSYGAPAAPVIGPSSLTLLPHSGNSHPVTTLSPSLSYSTPTGPSPSYYPTTKRPIYGPSYDGGASPQSPRPGKLPGGGGYLFEHTLESDDVELLRRRSLLLNILLRPGGGDYASALPQPRVDVTAEGGNAVLIKLTFPYDVNGLKASTPTSKYELSEFTAFSDAIPEYARVENIGQGESEIQVKIEEDPSDYVRPKRNEERKDDDDNEEKSEEKFAQESEDEKESILKKLTDFAGLK